MPILSTTRPPLLEADPFMGVPPDEWGAHAEALAQAHLEATATSALAIAGCVDRAFAGLLDHSMIRGVTLRDYAGLTSRVFGQMLHEEITAEIGLLPGWAEGADERHDKDLEFAPAPALGLELKGSQTRTGVSANRSYVEQTGSKERSSFYLVVNYVPPASRGRLQEPRIHTVRLGHLRSVDWNTERLDGRPSSGQIVSLRSASKGRLATIWTPEPGRYARPRSSRPAGQSATRRRCRA